MTWTEAELSTTAGAVKSKTPPPLAEPWFPAASRVSTKTLLAPSVSERSTVRLHVYRGLPALL